MSNDDKNPTDNHDLPRPVPGSFAGTWGEEIMNEDLTAKLEERLPIRDGEDVLEDYEPYEESTFLADSGAVYFGDGDAWDLVGSISGHESEIDVSNHGYPGDGTGGDLAELILDNPDSTFILPGGTYRLESEIDLEDEAGWNRFELVGVPGATIEVTSNDVDVAFRLGNEAGSLDEISIRNITVDITDDDVDAGLAHMLAAVRIENVNLELQGRRQHYELGGNKFSYFSCIVEEDGVGFHRNINLPDGGVWTGDNENSHAIGISTDPPHVGIQYWEGCYVAEHWDNGYYLKNSIGTNVTIGCQAENNGRNNIRIGRNDVAIGTQSRWDMDPDHEHYPEPIDGGEQGYGTLLDMDDGHASSVIGFYGVRETGETECVRVRTAAEQVTLQDIHIENYTDQTTLQITSNPDHPENRDDTRPARTLVGVDGCYIYEESGTAVEGAAVRVDRPHAHLDNITYINDEGSGDRSFIEIGDDAGVRVTNSTIDPYEDGYVVRQVDTGDRLEFDGCVLHSGIGIWGDQGGSINKLRIEACDLDQVDELFPVDGPDDGVVGNLMYGTTNFGLETRDYGRHLAREFFGDVFYTDTAYRIETEYDGDLVDVRYGEYEGHTTIYNQGEGAAGWLFRNTDLDPATRAVISPDGDLSLEGYVDTGDEIIAGGTVWAPHGGSTGFRIEDEDSDAGARFTLRSLEHDENFTTIYNQGGEGFLFRWYDSDEEEFADPIIIDVPGETMSLFDETVATEQWVEKDAVANEAENAETWDEYALVFDDEEPPEEGAYFRFETE